MELVQDVVTVGRLAQENDVSLEEDPQKLVTRVKHCVLERREGGWWVIDQSTNGTFLRRGEQIVEVQRAAPLEHGEQILILAKLPLDEEAAIYWELDFFDQEATHPVNQACHLEYDWIGARLYRVQGRGREEIADLRPQEHVLIRYMDRRNRENNYVPVMCTHEELIHALWEDDYGRSKEDVVHVVYRLRQKIEPDDEPQLLQTVHGLGYRLVTRAAVGEA